MKIIEAINNGVRRVYCPMWFEKNAYIKLPKKIISSYFVSAELFSDETQTIMKINTPQVFWLFCILMSPDNNYQLHNMLESQCEIYTGPISKFDKDDD